MFAGKKIIIELLEYAIEYIKNEVKTNYHNCSSTECSDDLLGLCDIINVRAFDKYQILESSIEDYIPEFNRKNAMNFGASEHGLFWWNVGNKFYDDTDEEYDYDKDNRIAFLNWILNKYKTGQI